MIIDTLAHAGFEVVLAEKQLPPPAGELGTLDALPRVKQRSGLIDLLLAPHNDAEDFLGDIAFEAANGFQL